MRRIVRRAEIYAGFACPVRPNHWGGCALFGDAAHAVSPALSESGLLCMADALVLAHDLGRFGEVGDALGAFRRARLQSGRIKLRREIDSPRNSVWSAHRGLREVRIYRRSAGEVPKPSSQSPCPTGRRSRRCR